MADEHIEIARAEGRYSWDSEGEYIEDDEGNTRSLWDMLLNLDEGDRVIITVTKVVTHERTTT